MSLTVTFTTKATQIRPSLEALDIHEIEGCDIADFPHIYAEVDTKLADTDGVVHYHADPDLDLDDIDVTWSTWGYLLEEISQVMLGVSTATVEAEINDWAGKPFVSIIDYPGSGTVLPPGTVKALAANIVEARTEGREAVLVEKLTEDYSEWMAGVYTRFAAAVEKVAANGGLVVFY